MYVGRPSIITAALVLGTASAEANPKTTKVTFETDPIHAKVYFGSEEDGEQCTTPCTIDAPVGETAIIIEAEGRQSKFENLVIPKKQAKPYKFTYTLDPALGTLILEGALPAGATIKIDDEDKGKASRRIENIPAGPHHITLLRDGKQVYEDFVDIVANQEYELSVPKTVASTDGGGGTGSGETAGGDGQTKITTTTEPKLPEPPRTTPYFVLMAIADVGFRQFSYQNNTTPNTVRDESEGGQALLGPVLELYPTTLLGLHTLPGLFLYARAEFNVNSQSVKGMGITHPMTTFWQSLEFSLRHRWMISSASFEVGAGYARDRYEFNGERTEITLVPDADYNAVKISARGSLVQDWFEPYVEGGYKIVVSDSGLGSRYALGHSVNGLHGALGAAIHVGAFQVRAEAALTMYTWTLKADTQPMFGATGATDIIEMLSLSLGYAY